MPKCFRPSIIATRPASLPPFRTKEKRPLAPVKSRFQSAWPGQPGRAGCRTRATSGRSEEHTSELQSLMRISYAVFCLQKTKQHTTTRVKVPPPNQQYTIQQL